MRLCVGTLKGIVILDPDRRAPLMVLADPASIWCMAQDCKDPDVIYAGSSGHHHTGMRNIGGAALLARSNDGGRTWHDITPRGAYDEDIWALATPPGRPDFVYVGTSNARLFRSEDAGRSFRESLALAKLRGRDKWTFPAAPHVPHVRSIAFDSSDSSTVYAGIEVGGVVRSRDRGESFEIINHGLYPDIHALAVDPPDPMRLYAATGNGFYVSSNGGASWHRMERGINRSYAIPIAMSPDGAVIYVAAAAGPPGTWHSDGVGANALLFRSIDRGRSFEPVASRAGGLHGMVMRLAVNPADADEFFGVCSDGTVIRIRNGEIITLPGRLPPAYDFVILP